MEIKDGVLISIHAHSMRERRFCGIIRRVCINGYKKSRGLQIVIDTMSY